MALVRKKLDDKILKTLRELVGVGGNKECFDCGQKGPTYINMTIGSFVCTSCSGILRGLTPPHRVKSISMATFTQEEIEFLKQNGNDNCSRTWLGLWDPKRAIKQEHRDFMIDKYERKRYYLEPASPLKSLPTNASSSLTSLSGGSNKNANESLVPLKTPTLTPPATLRLNRTNSGSCNGLNNVNASSSSLPGAIGGGTQFQQQFTPDDSGFFSADPPKILPPTPQKSHILQRKNGIKMKQHPANGLPATYGRNQKNGLLNNSSATGLSGSSGDINANKFTPDADFVADFGSATIVNNVSNRGSHYGSTSSLKNSNAVSDNGTGLYAQHNGNNGEVSAREMENFADFDHNPIFNSAENMKSYFSSNSIDSSTTNSVSSTASVQSLAGPDPFASFYSNTVAANNCGSNSTGSTVGTPTASSGSASTGMSMHGVGYTCISPEDNSRAKVHTNYGFGNTFSEEPRYVTNEGIINGSAGTGPSYAHLQNYKQPWGNSNGAQPEFNSARYAGSTNQLNNNASTESSQHDTVQWNFWQQFGNNCWSTDGRLQSHHQQHQQQHQQHQQFSNGGALQMMSPQHRASNQVNFYSDQNRWSLPMLHGTNNGGSKTSNGKPSNASINSTPSVDRYAALKDLDEQFREIKLEQQAEANNNTITSNGTATTISDSITPTSSANPFKTANPFQPLQQQPHAQQQTMAWPISGAINGTTPDARHPVTNGGTGFYATSPYQGGFAHSASPQLYNGNVVNGGSTMGATMGYLPAMGYPPNHGNNGYPGAQGMNGVMMGGQFNVTANGGGASILGNVAGVGNPVHHFANFGNPFMAAGTTAGNSNNPFL